MDVLKRLNDAIEYVEKHLCDDISVNEVSRIALCTPDGFNRFFSYMTSMTLNEYIRHRRLTLAAYELRNTNSKVIDIAVKYNFDSADAFTKAFVKQHGITPRSARLPENPLKIYPPISFHISIIGAKEMDFRIVDTKRIVLRGLGKKFTCKAAERFPQEHIMWADHHEDVQNKVCATIPGIWYGIWDNGTYWIAKPQEDVPDGQLDEVMIENGKYAVFRTGFGGFAGDELPKLRELIFDSWLNDSGYTQIRDCEIEVYHLLPKSEKNKRYYEIWIPVDKQER
ncbi:MAG TPA: AraC family transcriptional regulator [Clostridia bacterium]|nr:AraC family transcriptional regulator [Clostridia bacterium]